MAASDQNAHTDAMNRLAASNEAIFTKGEKKDAEGSKFSPGKLVGALAKNSTAVLGLSQGLLSIKGIFAQSAKDNRDIVKQLSLFTVASTQSTRAMTASLDTGFSTLKEGIATQGELVNEGLGEFSKSNKEGFIAMKALGINLKSVIGITRFNSEAVGLSTEASVKLGNDVVGAAIKNGTSMGALTGAIEGMKTALMKTTVELGPAMSEKVQRVALRMAQGNSEMAGAATQFVTSFLAGEEGFMKATKLGVGFTGQESEAELASKIEELSRRIVQMGAGAQGFGGGVTFQRFEDAFGLTRENFRVAQEMGTSIKSLKTASAKGAAERFTQLDASRQVEVSMFKIQARAVDVQQGIASIMSNFSTWLPAMIVILGTISTVSQLMLAKQLSFGKAGTGATKFMGGAALAMGTVAAAMIGKSMFDIVKSLKEGNKVQKKDIGTAAGGVAGIIGGAMMGMKMTAVTGPVGAAIGGLAGAALGGIFGGMFDKKDPEKNQKEAVETAKRAYGVNEEVAKDTAEIKRIQEDQARRSRSLASPQLSILTSINDILVENMMALQRANRQREAGNEVIKDMSFNSGAQQIGKFSGNIGNF